MKTSKIDEMDQKTLNIFENLKGQVNATFKHSHECSFKTRETYQERMEVFCKFMALEYRKQNINKISNDHLTHYVQYLQEKGLSTSYVTTSMSAIRYFYKKAVGDRFKIKSNKSLGVDARTKNERIGKDRAISDEDYLKLLENAKKEGNKENEFAFKLGMTLGLRIHELFKINKSQIKEALKNGEIKIKGKGGFIRSVPIGENEKLLLKEVISSLKSDNNRIFVNKGKKTHIKIKALEAYVRNSKENKAHGYTYHSLRHSYAQKLYKILIIQGFSDFEARMTVSRRLGHNRLEVSDIYLSAVE